MVITEPLRSSDYPQMSQNYEEDESSSDSGDSYKKGRNGKKRKTTDEDEEEPGQKEFKRQKNREAAKRCREKKQKQTEDLQKRNDELERENTDLVAEKQKLLEQCKEYEDEIKQHRHRGCSMPHFSPPYDIEEFINPPTPPSPSLSSSPCPSPVPSPVPPARQQRQQLAPQPTGERLQQVGAKIRGMELQNETAANVLQQPSQPVSMMPELEAESYIIKAVDVQGNLRTVTVSRETYLKLKMAGKIPNQPAITRPQMQVPTSTVTTVAPSQLAAGLQHIKTEPVDPVTSCEMHNQQVDLTNDDAGSGRAVVSMTDVYAMIQEASSASAKKLEFVPVNDPEVAAMIKTEPPDFENPQVNAIKQQLMNSPQSQQPMTTASQIRAGLDAVLNPDQSDNGEPSYRMITQEDGNVLLIPSQNQVPAYIQGQAQVRQLSGGRPVSSTVTSGGKSAALVTNMQAGKGQSFVTSTAPIGTLKNVRTAPQGMQNAPQARGKHPPGVQLRADAISKHMAGSVTRQPMVSIQTSRPTPSGKQITTGANGQQYIQVDTAQTQEAKFQNLKNSAWNGNPGKTMKQVPGNQAVLRGKQMPAASKNMQMQQQQQPVQTVYIMDQSDGQSSEFIITDDILQTDPVSEASVSIGQQLGTDVTTSMGVWNSGQSQAVIPEAQTVTTYHTGQIQEYLKFNSMECFN